MGYSYDHRNAASVPADYDKAKALRAEIEAEVDRTSKALKELSGGGAFNLTPDSVRSTSEWQKAKREADKAFAELRSFNTVFTRRFKKEIQEDRRNRRR